MQDTVRMIHQAGAAALGLGLTIVWVFDLRGRRARTAGQLAAASRAVAVTYDAVVVPGALTMLLSGGWMIGTVYSASFIDSPWLAAMVIGFLVEFVEGNTVTRLFFRRLRRDAAAAAAGRLSAVDAQDTRDRLAPAFTHFLDLPAFGLLVWLGIVKPADWLTITLAAIVAVGVALIQMRLFRARHRLDVTFPKAIAAPPRSPGR